MSFRGGDKVVARNSKPCSFAHCCTHKTFYLHKHKTAVWQTRKVKAKNASTLRFDEHFIKSLAKNSIPSLFVGLSRRGVPKSGFILSQ